MSGALLHRVAIAGASGRMGRMLIEAVLAAPDCRLAGALDVPGSPALGQDAGAFAGKATGVMITGDLRAGLAQADVLIDFTRPEGTMAHLAACREAGVKLVIGTTGLNEEHKARVQAAGEQIAILMAPNMGVGVNVLIKLLELAGKALQDGFDVEVIEAHHKHKVDAPSGTALALGEAVARAQGKSLKDCAVYARQGHTGERQAGTIGFATIRGGDIFGDHTVLFAGEGERVEITHKSSGRGGWAQGALRAARFLAGRPKGLFDMQDVLQLR
jgi:4-hydroxy-tetrahydrodipicolinate reductase